MQLISLRRRNIRFVDKIVTSAFQTWSLNSQLIYLHLDQVLDYSNFPVPSSK